MSLKNFIELFLAGDDDKVYIDIFSGDDFNEIYHDIRIIHPNLVPLYDNEIIALQEGVYNLAVILKKEDPDEHMG